MTDRPVPIQVERAPLAAYLGREYAFHTVRGPDGSYLIAFPDLPGCVLEAPSHADVGHTADQARVAWITATYARGGDIPWPSYPSGDLTLLAADLQQRLRVRLPQSGGNADSRTTRMAA